jgi:hypothetical protein
MQKWEYRFELGTPNITELNKLGGEGWEMVTVFAYGLYGSFEGRCEENGEVKMQGELKTMREFTFTNVRFQQHKNRTLPTF